MEKIRFRNTIVEGVGNWNGSTLVNTAPTFEFVNGFTEATLPFRVGRLPAALFGKAPACDCYVVLITMWTDRDPVDEDLVGVDTVAPVRTRESWAAVPGNTHAALVRPDDEIWFFQSTTGDAVLELLIEPLANTNEFGEILLRLAQQAAESAALAVAEQALAVAEQALEAAAQAQETADNAVAKVDNQPAAEFTLSLNTPPDIPNIFVFRPQYDGEFRWFQAVLLSAAALTAEVDIDLTINGVPYPTPLHFDVGETFGASATLFLTDADFIAGTVVTVLATTANAAEIYASITLDMIRH